MLRMKFVFGLILIKYIVLREANGECNGEPEVIIPGSGLIESRHYPSERTYVHCSWQFSKPSDEEYVLVIDTGRLRYFYEEYRRNFPATVSLTINSDEVLCDGPIGPINRDNCKAYYSSSTCNAVLPRDCGINKKVSFPMVMNLVSRNFKYINRFSVAYRYIECPPAATSTIDSVTQTTTDLFTTRSNSRPDLKKFNQSMVTKSVVNQSYFPAADNSECSQSNWPIFVFVLGGVVLILLVIVAVLLILLIRSRRQLNAATPTALYPNGDTSMVAPGNENTSKAPDQIEYVNISARNQQEIENPYEIPIRQNMDS